MSPATKAVPRTAAFFDVDGTLAETNITHYYAYFRCKHMSPVSGRLWRVAFLLRCIHYWLLDKVDRNRLNVIFYRRYAGLLSDEIRAMATECYADVIAPRCFEEALACVSEHRRVGDAIVLVTGSLDFVIQPLAAALEVSAVLAPTLAEMEGRFTGELTGPPVGADEKAHQIRDYAVAEGIDLAHSHAYGDSVADVPMLETVGHPHAVNPDRRLAVTAAARGWPIHCWTVPASRDATVR